MTEDKMVGWHHLFSRHGFEWTLGVSDGQSSLAGYSPQGGKELDTTEVTEYSTMVLIKCKSISCL